MAFVVDHLKMHQIDNIPITTGAIVAELQSMAIVAMDACDYL